MLGDQPGTNRRHYPTDVGHHLEYRQNGSTSGRRTDNIGNRGLLGRTHEAGADTSHCGNGEEHHEVVGESHCDGSQTADK